MSVDYTKFKSNIDNKDMKLLYFTGGWCPMCRTAMPQTIDIFNKLQLEKDRVEIIEVNPYKTEPADKLKDNKIFFVPTIVVMSGEKELGRITETPTKSWEEDLFEISGY